ncbi:hypothetical protein DMN91_008684 [Ooceraea biroi]|uniref:Endonuclease/exonuclease/phosphatase domain-containing protein n=1 Tax=Ooceraea biroi TaxID=2015173 RepID=A0A3L8DCY3_OOCBI|nr:uncharacterized protein LOC105287897 [Ooceraea biroi]RLU18327.1 hypothetical protein DMN91_008684 [Ooceraea biroi]
MASVYISPSVSVAVYLNFLDDFRDFVLTTRGELLICGDFNTRSLSWGCRSSNRRGELLKELISELDLRLCNVDGFLTCVRTQGSSMVDLMLASPSCSSRLRSWHVLTGVESLSDHLYIVFFLDGLVGGSCSLDRPRGRLYPRWCLKNMNKELFVEVISFQSTFVRPDLSATALAAITGNILLDACDLAARRVRSGPRRRIAYWWNDDVAAARKLSIAARRKWMKFRYSADVELRERMHDEYRSAKRNLRKLVRSSKAKSWNELLHALDDDP